MTVLPPYAKYLLTIHVNTDFTHVDTDAKTRKLVLKDQAFYLP